MACWETISFFSAAGSKSPFDVSCNIMNASPSENDVKINTTISPISSG